MKGVRIQSLSVNTSPTEGYVVPTDQLRRTYLGYSHVSHILILKYRIQPIVAMAHSPTGKQDLPFIEACQNIEDGR